MSEPAPDDASTEGRGPRRTCVACREEADRDELVRLVLSPDGEVVVDYRAKLPGRGAWVHPTRACVGTLERQPGRLERPLGGKIAKAALLEQLMARTREALLDGLSMAAAAGALIGGHDVLEQALREQRVDEVVIAEDASPRTVDDLRRIAPDVPFTVLPIGRDALGERVGRGARAALGVTPSRSAIHLRRQLRRLRLLG